MSGKRGEEKFECFSGEEHVAKDGSRFKKLIGIDPRRLEHRDDAADDLSIVSDFNRSPGLTDRAGCVHKELPISDH